MVDSSLKPSAPIIHDEDDDIEKGKNVKFLHRDIGIIHDYDKNIIEKII